MLDLRTARANGVPLSLLRRGGKVKWRPMDRALAVALTMYEDGLCSGCGQPRDRAWNDDMAGYYEPHTALCLACNAVHTHVEDDRGGKLRPGERAYVTDSAPAGFAPDPRMTTVN